MAPPGDAHRPRVLVVDADPVTRRMLRLGLELDGAHVVEAATAGEALELCKGADGFAGAAVDGQLPDGSWVEVSAALDGTPTVVLVADSDELDLPPRVKAAPKGDFPAVVSALGLRRIHDQKLSVVGLLQSETAEIEADWKELCLWDPMLPPDSQPPIATAIISGLIEALGRPQPLGWGADPEVEKVAEVYARAVGAIDVAIGQLVCLREVLRRRVGNRIPPDEWAETDDRLHMVIDRAIAVAAFHTAERLQEQAFLDPLTGLMNRRALERDLRREVGRATRSGRRFGLVIMDLDGLKQINDTEGHNAGDERLRTLADAVQESLRLGDAAYRVGGDEFVMLLPETDDAPIHHVIDRVVAAGAPRFSWGASTFPDDGDDLMALLDAADVRLFEQRRLDRSPDRRFA